MNLKLFILCALPLIAMTTRESVSPMEWGQLVFSMLQSEQTDALVDIVFVTKAQMKSTFIEELKATGDSGELTKKIEDDVFFATLYDRMKNEFVQDLTRKVTLENMTEWSQAKLDSVTYSYIVSRYNDSDIEISWPRSQEYQLDSLYRTIARVQCYFSIASQHYVLHLTPFSKDKEWRLMDAQQGVYLEQR